MKTLMELDKTGQESQQTEMESKQTVAEWQQTINEFMTDSFGKTLAMMEEAMAQTSISFHAKSVLD